MDLLLGQLSGDAAALVGGWVYLHSVRGEPSFFGGIVTAAEPVVTPEHAREDRFAFIFSAKPKGRWPALARKGSSDGPDGRYRRGGRGARGGSPSMSDEDRIARVARAVAERSASRS